MIYLNVLRIIGSVDSVSPVSFIHNANLTLSSNERAIEIDNPLDKKELKLTSLHHYRTDR